MTRARTLVSIVLLLSYGAVGARQPAVRTSVPLPAPAAQLAEALGLATTDRSRVVIDIIRLVFDSPDGNDTNDVRLRVRLNALIQAGNRGETAPLPLDPSIWRDTLLMRDVPDHALLGAILSDRRTALLYHGLAALDDETLAWLGPDRALLADLSEHAGMFAAFGRSLRVKGGRVQVPGGPGNDAVWSEVVGASPAQPAAFARRLFARSDAHLAFFYDTVAHLDERSRVFVLSGKPDRVRALEQVFERSTLELKPQERPFSRQYLDPSLTLTAIDVSADGTPSGPLARGLWDLVFKGDDKADYTFREAALPKNADATPLDAAWIASRIHRNSSAAGRRRLDTFLFAQRVFRKTEPGDVATLATALRGMLSFPSLMLALERAGVQSPAIYAGAAVRAHALNGIGDPEPRRVAVMQFQSALAIVERMVQTGGLAPDKASSLIALLTTIDLAAGEGSERLASWIVDRLVPAVGSPAHRSTLEASVLHGMGGARPTEPVQTIEWEERQYRVNAADAEFARLRNIRRRQGGPSLDQALAPLGTSVEVRSGSDRTRQRDVGLKLAQVLTSIVYAAYLGDPEGPAMAGGNVAIRHDLGLESGAKPNPLNAWRIASESFGGPGGWMLRGSLLGLEAPLAKYAIRRIDNTVMPPAPRLTSNERQTAALTVALMRPHAMHDAARDRIVAALERGRARVAALKNDHSVLDDLADDAGLSEWRRQALAWALANDPGRIDEQLTLMELLWLGTPAGSPLAALDPWGAAGLAVKGCLCLAMPRRGQWESLSGRPAAGILATRGADVGLLVAEALARLRLPAALAPGVAAFAMQDVLDATQPAYFDDWSQFGRAATTISNDRIVDYVAALTAGGPLMPLTENGKQP